MTTILDHQMSAILLRLELVSHGQTQAWNPSGGHSGEPDDRMVALVAQEPKFPHLEWRRRYAEASEATKPAVVEAAKGELEAWTRRSVPPADAWISLEDQIVKDGEGFEALVVARRFNVDVAFVRRVRARRERGREDGRALGVMPDVSGRAERARELAARGLSTRQIAMMVGAHQTQVVRWIRAAA